MKVVHVVGASNSGKSSSIKKYLEDVHGIKVTHSGDTLVALPIGNKNNRRVLGVASGGDSAAIVKRNFAFFALANCDVVVCPSKSAGASLIAFQAEVTNIAALVDKITTTKLISGHAAANAKVAAEIDKKVRKKP